MTDTQHSPIEKAKSQGRIRQEVSLVVQEELAIAGITEASFSELKEHGESLKDLEVIDKASLADIQAFLTKCSRTKTTIKQAIEPGKKWAHQLHKSYTSNENEFIATVEAIEEPAKAKKQAYLDRIAQEEAERQRLIEEMKEQRKSSLQALGFIFTPGPPEHRFILGDTSWSVKEIIEADHETWGNMLKSSEIVAAEIKAAKEEEERKAKEERDRIASQQEEIRKQQEDIRKQHEELERLRQEEADRKAKEEEERRKQQQAQQEEVDRKEAEMKAREEQMQKAVNEVRKGELVAMGLEVIAERREECDWAVREWFMRCPDSYVTMYSDLSRYDNWPSLLVSMSEYAEENKEVLRVAQEADRLTAEIMAAPINALVDPQRELNRLASEAAHEEAIRQEAQEKAEIVVPANALMDPQKVADIITSDVDERLKQPTIAQAVAEVEAEFGELVEVNRERVLRILFSVQEVLPYAKNEDHPAHPWNDGIDELIQDVMELRRDLGDETLGPNPNEPW